MSAVLRLVDWSDESDVPEPAGSAIERYKEIVATATEAHARMRAHDAARNAELSARIGQTQERVAEISEREQMVRFGAELHWEAAKKQLWNETWFRMTVFPKPDESVPPRPQGEYNAAMDAAYDVLEASLQKKPLLRRR
ncbi:hypothetical protein FKR81_22425 [Lentzea tibetensis]|uniref:Uncharacterized protein n=1 Tax=Lentzea tibetensis TaxID=2591470 RepID=A0A563EQH7_9PSEU|nr:hypothetical protein [Lentzea tibetensis]TWP49989.1 hypothetical protein FKR81_22425 [Lentzea tibetensis]